MKEKHSWEEDMVLVQSREVWTEQPWGEKGGRRQEEAGCLQKLEYTRAGVWKGGRWSL